MKSLIWKHKSDNIKSGKYVYIVWEEDDCIGTKVVRFKNTSQLYQQHKIPWCNVTKWAYLADLVNAAYKVNELGKQIEILKEALQFYAEGNHYTDGIDISGRPMDVILDRGSIAQSVLNKLDSWRKQ